MMRFLNSGYGHDEIPLQATLGHEFIQSLDLTLNAINVGMALRSFETLK
jgi:hypothetical protein